MNDSGAGTQRGIPLLLLIVGVVVAVALAVLLFKRPQSADFVLEVTVPAGNGFVGEITIDGVTMSIEGTVNRQFEFEGKSISWVVLIEEPADGAEIKVELSRGGQLTSLWGCRGSSERHNDQPDAMLTSVNESEWETEMERLRPTQPVSTE